MDTITFESLPAAVAEMKSTIDEMNRTLNRLMGDKYIPSDEPDRLMPLDEFREYLPEKRKPAAQTV